MARKERQTAEFGDFQTPPALAQEVCSVVSRLGVKPAAIVEPSCGTGTFLATALDCFGEAKRGVGIEIDPGYVEAAKATLGGPSGFPGVRIIHDSFFHVDWGALVRELPAPVLVIGNPPWVTNSALGCLGSRNLPAKRNFQHRSGIEAITGKSNFDISEWMLLRLLEALHLREATLAMLCKTAVARRVLAHAWKTGVSLTESMIFRIDASRHFGASVDACLLVCRLSPRGGRQECVVYDGLGGAAAERRIGYRDGRLVANLSSYERWKHLCGKSPVRWRSGIKHDCAKVMELRNEGGRLRNGLAEPVDLEEDYLYPMLKASALSKPGPSKPTRWMIVPQSFVGQDTAPIAQRAPKTWEYLASHKARLDRRASSIYRNQPPFSIFGVGTYSFSPWKVAISGFHKQLDFKVVGRFANKPIVLDDTCYFVGCRTKEQANYLARLVSSDAAREFFEAFTFWDAKRPVTSELLNGLDLGALARASGSETMFLRLLARGDAGTLDRGACEGTHSGSRVSM